jgi:hypothetical protein
VGDRARRLREPAESADDGAAEHVGDHADQDEEPDQHGRQTALDPVHRGVDPRLRRERRERDARRLVQLRRAKDTEARLADLRLVGMTHAPVQLVTPEALGPADDAVALQEDQLVLGPKARARAQEAEQRVVERHGDRDPAERAPSVEHVHRLERRRTRDRADREPRARSHDDVRRASQSARELVAIAGPERQLELRLGGSLRGGVRRVGDPVAVGDERRPQPRLEARIGAIGLAAPRERVEAPERGRERQQRQQHEVRDEFELEATHLRLDSRNRRSLPMTCLERCRPMRGEP